MGRRADEEARARRKSGRQSEKGGTERGKKAETAGRARDGEKEDQGRIGSEEVEGNRHDGRYNNSGASEG